MCNNSNQSTYQTAEPTLLTVDVPTQHRYHWRHVLPLVLVKVMQRNKLKSSGNANSLFYFPYIQSKYLLRYMYSTYFHFFIYSFYIEGIWGIACIFIAFHETEATDTSKESKQRTDKDC